MVVLGVAQLEGIVHGDVLGGVADGGLVAGQAVGDGGVGRALVGIEQRHLLVGLAGQALQLLLVGLQLGQRLSAGLGGLAGILGHPRGGAAVQLLHLIDQSLIGGGQLGGLLHAGRGGEIELRHLQIVPFLNLLAHRGEHAGGLIGDLLDDALRVGLAVGEGPAHLLVDALHVVGEAGGVQLDLRVEYGLNGGVLGLGGLPGLFPFGGAGLCLLGGADVLIGLICQRHAHAGEAQLGQSQRGDQLSEHGIHARGGQRVRRRAPLDAQRAGGDAAQAAAGGGERGGADGGDLVAEAAQRGHAAGAAEQARQLREGGLGLVGPGLSGEHLRAEALIGGLGLADGGGVGGVGRLCLGDLLGQRRLLLGEFLYGVFRAGELGGGGRARGGQRVQRGLRLREVFGAGGGGILQQGQRVAGLARGLPGGIEGFSGGGGLGGGGLQLQLGRVGLRGQLEQLVAALTGLPHGLRHGGGGLGEAALDAGEVVGDALAVGGEGAQLAPGLRHALRKFGGVQRQRGADVSGLDGHGYFLLSLPAAPA